MSRGFRWGSECRKIRERLLNDFMQFQLFSRTQRGTHGLMSNDGRLLYFVTHTQVTD